MALERKKKTLESFVEIEPERPEYLGAQDAYYVGNIKSVGRNYQKIFIRSNSSYYKLNGASPSALIQIFLIFRYKRKSFHVTSNPKNSQCWTKKIDW